jgi:hypothetical protein
MQNAEVEPTRATNKDEKPISLNRVGSNLLLADFLLIFLIVLEE